MKVDKGETYDVICFYQADANVTLTYQCTGAFYTNFAIMCYLK